MIKTLHLPRAFTAATTTSLLLLAACGSSASPATTPIVNSAPVGSTDTTAAPTPVTIADTIVKVDTVDAATDSTVAATTANPTTADPATVLAGVTVAQEFLATLTADQRASAMFDYSDLNAKQTTWSNFPVGIFDGRQGARMGDLDETQRAAALAAVESLMSAVGYSYVEAVMAGDEYLAGNGGMGSMGQDNYYLAFYGEPSADTPWTLQFGGHHLAIHISSGGDTLSVSPYFQGLQPVSFELEGTTIEAMSVDADHLFGLFESMDDTQLAAAKLGGNYDDLVMGPGADIGYPAAEGVPYTDLTAAQQELVRAAISDWVADAAPGLSGPFVALYESQLDQTVVSWASSIERESGAYMRIDGPRVWIEWVNTTAGGGLHYHTIYRDKLVDYGTGSAQ